MMLWKCLEQSALDMSQDVYLLLFSSKNVIPYRGESLVMMLEYLFLKRNCISILYSPALDNR